MEKIKRTPIETDRLILRPYCENDLDDVFEYASSSDVTRFLLWDAHKTKKR